MPLQSQDSTTTTLCYPYLQEVHISLLCKLLASFINSTRCVKCRLEQQRSHGEYVLTTAVRIGLGHDTHRVGSGGNMLLGGVQIECDHHLIGHSDADVLLHAITDAILGASALGDIGE